MATVTYGKDTAMSHAFCFISLCVSLLASGRAQLSYLIPKRSAYHLPYLLYTAQATLFDRESVSPYRH